MNSNSSLTDLPVTLYPSRTRYIGLLVLSLLFIVMGLFLVSKGDRSGWSFVLIFLFASAVAGIYLLPNSCYLTLEAEGFTLCTVFRKRFIKWADVVEFRVIRLRGRYGIGGAKVVGWNLTRDNFTKGKKALSSVSRALAGADACLPMPYKVKAAELAERMNHLLQESRGLHPQGLSPETSRFGNAELTRTA